MFFSVKYLFNESKDVSLMMENRIYSNKSISFLNAKSFSNILKTFISFSTFCIFWAYSSDMEKAIIKFDENIY